MALVKLSLDGGTGGTGGTLKYTAPNGAVVTSSARVYTNSTYYYMRYLFSGDTTYNDANNYWLTDSGGDQTLEFDFTGVPSIILRNQISKIRVYPNSRPDASSNYYITGLNKSSGVWENIVAPWIINPPGGMPTVGHYYDHDITQRYDKIRFHLTQNGSWGVTLNEIEFYYNDYVVGDAQVDFNYTGAPEIFKAPYTGQYELEVWGAEGGDAGYNGAILTNGAKGGYAKGYIQLVKDEELVIFVGGKGTSGTNTVLSNALNGGFNGGGSGANGNSVSSRGSGGGGGTDIRRKGSTLAHRVIVAGGGGGAVYFPSYGVNYPGSGGGTIGLHGATSSYPTDQHSGKGGTQSSGGIGGSNGGAAENGSLGKGGNANQRYGHGEAGGGGGYYGGGGSGTGMGAGGGSGYIGGVSGGVMNTGVQSGNGRVRIGLDLLSNFVTSVDIDKTHVLSGDQVEVSWLVSSREEFAFLEGAAINYKIEVDLGLGFIEVIKGLSRDIRSYTYTIPKNTSKYNSATFRVRSYDPTIDPYDIVSTYSAPFIIDKYSFVIKSNDKYYTYQINDWVEIGEDNSKDWFYEYGMGDINHIPESKWDELSNPISLVTFTNSSTTPVVDVTVPPYKPIYLLEQDKGDLTIRSNEKGYLNRVANPHGQLIVQKKDITLNAPTMPRLIKKITFKGATIGSPSSNRRVVLSVDKGKSFYTWKNSQWEIIGGVSRDVVQVDGMTIEEVNARTEKDWYELFKDKPRQVRFAYYLEMNLFSDQLTIDEVEFLMDITGSWRKASKEEYEYAYPNDEVLQIDLFKDGHYKINY